MNKDLSMKKIEHQPWHVKLFVALISILGFIISTKSLASTISVSYEAKNPPSSIIDMDASHKETLASNYDIQLSLNQVDCQTNTVCYDVQLKSSNGTPWGLAGQNYRLYYDGALASYQSGISLLNSDYQNFTLVQDAQNINAASTGSLPFASNLSFLNYSIDLSNTFSGGINLPSDGSWVSTSQICFDVQADLLNDPNTCFEAVWARNGLTNDYATSFVEVSEWVATDNTQKAQGVGFNDLDNSDGEAACLANSCTNAETYDIQLSLNQVDCQTNTVCYDVQLKSSNGTPWGLAGQNYRLYYDGALASYQSGTSLLNSDYQNFTLVQDAQNVNAASTGSLPFASNLSFLNYSIDLSNTFSGGINLPSDGSWVSTSQICFNVQADLLNDPNTCFEAVWARNGLTNDYATSFVEVSEWVATDNTQKAQGAGFNDLDNSDGEAACLANSCTNAETYDIQLSLNQVDCQTNTVCYDVQLKSSNGTPWGLAGQNYRLYYDGALASYQSGTSLLNSDYQNFTLVQDAQNINAASTGSLPFASNLSFLNYSIDLSNTFSGGINLPSDGSWVSTSQICFNVQADLLNDPNTCFEAVWARNGLTNDYATSFVEVSEWVAADNTQNAQGAGFNDLDNSDGEAACLANSCTNAETYDIQLSLNQVDCQTNTVCYDVQLKSSNGTPWGLAGQNYRLYYDGALASYQSGTSLLNSDYQNFTLVQDAQNINAASTGSLPFASNLSFLNYSIDLSNTFSGGINLPSDGSWVSTSQICFDVQADLLNDPNTCFEAVWARNGLTNDYATSFVEVSEWVATDNTQNAQGVGFNDLDNSDGEAACLANSCNTLGEYAIQLSLNNLDCQTNTACYDVQLQSTDGTSWGLAGQNYRLYYDAVLGSYQSGISLLSTTDYSNYTLVQDIQHSDAAGTGNFSFENDLGFLNYTIDLKNTHNGGIYLPADGSWLTTSQLCFQLTDEVINDPAICFEAIWAREAQTAAYATSFVEVAEWVSADNTRAVKGTAYDDLNDCLDGTINCTAFDCSTSIVTANDSFNSCPGSDFTNNVAFNDQLNIFNTAFKMVNQPTKGTVVLENNGRFEYTPNDNSCYADQFSYEACNLNTGCCDTALVTINFADNSAPALYNIPADETISCDELIALPSLVSATDNCPRIDIDILETSTQGEDGCAFYDYTLTRTWIATDGCGNTTSANQVIDVQDKTAPDIFQIYTLPNGKKMVAGVMEKANQNWKTIFFPIDFPSKPLVFCQVITKEDTAPVITRIKNVSNSQFEVKLQEENVADGQHSRESIAWVAIEQGNQSSNFPLEAKQINLSNELQTLTFEENYTSVPSFFATMQTTRDKDPASIRCNNATTSEIEIQLQEEISADTNVEHDLETTAFLGIASGIDLINKKGHVFGETGTVSVNHQWTTVQTQHQYYHPVVITGIPQNNEAAPGVVSIQKVGASSFDIRFQEWTYLDGTHAAEQVPYMIIEGSLPLDVSIFCETGTDNLVIGKDMIAIDNCNINIDLQYEETEIISSNTKEIVRTWYAADECGNATGLSQSVICEGRGLRLKAMLQGAMLHNGETNLMRDDLRRKGLLPMKEPYSLMQQFKHAGKGGGETCTAELFDITGEKAIVDWVFVELKPEDNQEKVVATTAALIQRSGTVVSTKGDSILFFENLPQGNYFVTLRHRNHLKAETKYPYLFSANHIPYVDFTNKFLPTLGAEAFVKNDNKNELWSGDLNQDEKTIFQGPRNDIFNMFVEVIADTLNERYLTNYISKYYTVNDFNLDGVTIYQGPNNDRANLLFNTILIHPENDSRVANFILSSEERELEESHLIVDENGMLYDPYKDSDGDGISDHQESLNGTDNFNPCDPYQNPQFCANIDKDEDGFFANYPSDHPLFDQDDRNSCAPNELSADCDCPDSADNGYIFVCHTTSSGNKQTLKVIASDWLSRKTLGDSCGPCQE